MTKEKFNYLIMDVLAQLFRYKTIVHITHGDDADGIGCEIAMRYAFSRRSMKPELNDPDYRVIYSHAGNKPVMENIKIAVTEILKSRTVNVVEEVLGRKVNNLIIISDLAFFKEGYDYLKENLPDDTNFIWIDHHIGDDSEGLKEVLITNSDYHSSEELENVFYWEKNQIKIDYSPIGCLYNLLDFGYAHTMKLSATATLAVLLYMAEDFMDTANNITAGFYEDLISSISLGDTYSHKYIDTDMLIRDYMSVQYEKVIKSVPSIAMLARKNERETVFVFDWPATLSKKLGLQYFKKVMIDFLMNTDYSHIHRSKMSDRIHSFIEKKIQIILEEIVKIREINYKIFEGLIRNNIGRDYYDVSDNPKKIAVSTIRDSEFSYNANRYLDEHPDIDAVYAIYVYNGEYSIDTRSTGERMNVMQQMKDHYDGGGHVLAAGGTMSKEVYEWYMDKVVGEFNPTILE